MRLSCVLACVLLAAFLQCAREETIDLPPEEELIDIFVDLHIAEAAITRVSGTARDSVGSVVREKIASKYGLGPDELQAIVAEVQRRPDMNIAIYDSVINKLQQMKEPAKPSKD